MLLGLGIEIWGGGCRVQCVGCRVWELQLDERGAAPGCVLHLDRVERRLHSRFGVLIKGFIIWGV